MNKVLKMQKAHLLLVLFVASTALISSDECARADQELIYSTRITEERSSKSYQERIAEKKIGADENKPIVKDETITQKITFGDEYLSVDQDRDFSLINFESKKLFVVHKTDRTYNRIDLHALLYFRILEIQNRKMLGGLLDSVKIENVIGDRFDLESVFGFNDPTNKTRLEVEARITDKGRTDFLYQKKIVASVLPSQYEIEPALCKNYDRFLLYTFKVHPAIRAKLLKMNIPKEMNYAVNDSTIKETYQYNLVSKKFVPKQSPSVPKDYALKLDSQLQKLTEQHALVKANSARDMDHEYSVFVDDAIKKKNYLDGFLAATEQYLSTDKGMDLMTKLKPFVPTDPAIQQYAQAAGNMSSKEETQKAISALESIDRSKLKKGYVIDIMLANDYASIGEPRRAEELFLSVLSHNPLITGVYHDLGMLYLKQFETDRAWECFHLADSCMPNHPMMMPIHQMEKRLETDFPEFF